MTSGGSARPPAASSRCSRTESLMTDVGPRGNCLPSTVVMKMSLAFLPPSGTAWDRDVAYQYKTKICVVCKGEFTPNSGVAKTCSPECRLKKNTANQDRWHRAHPERTAAAHRKAQPKREEWLRNNRARMAASAAAWRSRNADFWTAYMQQWREDNRERARAYDTARRAQRTLSRDDRELSVAYRKVIRHDPCFYCGESTDEMHFDHFIALKRGGTDHWWNLVRSCSTCNERKNAHCGTFFLLKVGP